VCVPHRALSRASWPGGKHPGRTALPGRFGVTSSLAENFFLPKNSFFLSDAWFHARTPTARPKCSPARSSALAHLTFFAGFRPEGDCGGDLFFGSTGADATRCTGVLGPNVFVRRYRVPQALHNIGFDAGPLRHCGESVFGKGEWDT
jgi:hypothetical protein